MKRQEPVKDPDISLKELENPAKPTLFHHMMESGWWGFLKYVFAEDPSDSDSPTLPTVPILLPASEWQTVIFISDSNELRGFQPVINMKFTNLDVLLWTAMGRGLSVRPIRLPIKDTDRKNWPVALRFVPSPFYPRTGNPPSLEIVRSSLAYPTTRERGEDGKSKSKVGDAFEDVLVKIHDNYQIEVRGHELLNPLRLRIDIDMTKLTFVEVMDQLAAQCDCDANWDWFGDSALILLAPGSPTINYG